MPITTTTTFPIDRLNPHFPAARLRTPTQVTAQPCDANGRPVNLTGDPTQDFPWLYPPVTAQDFTMAAVIDLPAIGVESDILTFTAPVGWDGIITQVSHEVIGGAFNQGDGSLIFRILRNGQPVPSYGQMFLTYGTAMQPRALAFGIPILANGVIQYRVANVSMGAGGVRVAATMAGWYWKIAKGYDR